ncbi:MAG TPA: IMP dehydrogenase [Aggregatilineales bacterium]|nr:IMP dehydrogenase [Aggregatilineales bacterium]
MVQTTIHPIRFEDMLNPETAEPYICERLAPFEQTVDDYLRPWRKESMEKTYPSQGLIRTSYDDLDYVGQVQFPEEKMVEILRVRAYLLEVFNHPDRLAALQRETETNRPMLPAVRSNAIETLQHQGTAISIADLGAVVLYPQGRSDRISRKQRLREGPFVKIGRSAHSPFVGSAMPDVFGSVPAIATMAASHSLVCLPRNAVFVNIQRQADLAATALRWLDEEPILNGRPDRDALLELWRGNIIGTVEASPDKALRRAEALYKAGIRKFRPYSPEPGPGPEQTTQALRRAFGDDVELFVGQIVDVDQARRVEEAGADALYIGIGGGGRCKTGPRSGTVIDWPELLWSLRGRTTLPIVVEGGASEHVAETLLAGASGIGVSRMAAGGTIEAPGGGKFFTDHQGRLFKPYGGEASARTKVLEGKMLAFGIPMFPEGETAPAFAMQQHPTITLNLYHLCEAAVLALVFRGVSDIYSLQSLDPSPLRLKTAAGAQIQKPHEHL